jgi:hypothetical protein
MHMRYPAETRRQVVELARSRTRVAQLAEAFATSEVTIYPMVGSAPGWSAVRCTAANCEGNVGGVTTETGCLRPD